MSGLFKIQPSISPEIHQAVTDLLAAFPPPWALPAGAVFPSDWHAIEDSKLVQARQILIDALLADDPRGHMDAVGELHRLTMAISAPPPAPYKPEENAPLIRFLGAPMRDAVLSFVANGTRNFDLRYTAMPLLARFYVPGDEQLMGEAIYKIFKELPASKENNGLRYLLLYHAAIRGHPFSELEQKCLLLLRLFTEIAEEDQLEEHSFHSDDGEGAEADTSITFIEAKPLTLEENLIVEAASALAARSPQIQSALTALVLQVKKEALQSYILGLQCRMQLPWSAMSELVQGALRTEPSPNLLIDLDLACNADMNSILNRFYRAAEPGALAVLNTYKRRLETQLSDTPVDSELYDVIQTRLQNLTDIVMRR